MKRGTDAISTPDMSQVEHALARGRALAEHMLASSFASCLPDALNEPINCQQLAITFRHQGLPATVEDLKYLLSTGAKRSQTPIFVFVSSLGWEIERNKQKADAISQSSPVGYKWFYSAEKDRFKVMCPSAGVSDAKLRAADAQCEFRACFFFCFHLLTIVAHIS
jgi:hypothetical protein